MMEKEKALESLIQITNCNLGFIPSTPAEFSDLSATIYRKTKYRISVSSIKRLWGYVKYEGFPTKTTLNILARFNDFHDWETFYNEISYSDKAESTSAFVDGSILNAGLLTVGDVLTLKWNSNKSCTLEYIAYLRFRVIKADNIKLCTDDLCTISSICIGMPLLVSNIQRGNAMIPAYVGAKNGGILSISTQ